MGRWFGASWQTIGYVMLSTTAIYVSTVVAIRLAGRRTLAQLSAFDVVITVALGTLVSSTAVSSEPSYSQGMAALLTLLGLQVVIAALRRRFAVVRRLSDFEPETVLEGGRPKLSANPLTAQMTLDELASKLREQGVFEVSDVALVVLEPTGGLSVRKDADGTAGIPR